MPCWLMPTRLDRLQSPIAGLVPAGFDPPTCRSQSVASGVSFALAARYNRRMSKESSDDLLTIREAAELRDCCPETIRKLVLGGSIPVARHRRPVLIATSVVLALTIRKQGRPVRGPGPHVRRIGGTRLDLDTAAAGRLFGVSRQAVHAARRRVREYHDKQAGNEKNGKVQK